MNMKKIISMFSLTLGLLVCATVLVSCSKDDDDKNTPSSNPLVGTWYTESEDKGEIEYTEVTYNADFSCSWREYESDRTTLKDSDTGKYEVSGNKLSIWWNSEAKYWDEDGPWTTTFTINGNKMTTSENGGTTWTKK